MAFGGRANGPWSKVDQVGDKLVWMLCLDAQLTQAFSREVVEVERDDHGGRATDRRRKHMTVIGVGQRESLDQVFLPAD